MGDIGSEICYHFGSGNNISGSQYALHCYYREVICVDPRLVAGDNSISGCFDMSNIPPGHDIYSDVAYGDEFGMITDHDEKNISLLYKYACDNLENNIVMKFALQPGIGARAEVLYKARPHNLELIVRLTPDGETFDEIYAEGTKRFSNNNSATNSSRYSMTKKI